MPTSPVPIQAAGKVNIAAPPEQVWDLLFDVETMKGIVGRIPGIVVERLEQVDENVYETNALVTVAVIRGKYDGTITVLEKRAPHYVRVKGEGQGGGNQTSGEVSLTLAPHPEGTEMVYAGLGYLSGPLANLGQRLVDTVGRQFIDQGAKLLAVEIGARHLARVTPPPPVTGPVVDIAFALAVMASVLALVVYLSIRSLAR